MNLIFCGCFILVDGGYTQWTTFSECSNSCGIGQALRSRYCINPRPSHGGKMCSGGPFEEQHKPCKVAECPGISLSIVILKEKNYNTQH